MGMLSVACVLLVQPALVTVEVGNLPLVISAPHGGTAAVPNVPPRKGNGVRQFTTVRDTNTDLLARALADRVYAETGKRPHLVIAHFSRKYIDANRAAKDAYESEAASDTYDLFHHGLREACRQAKTLGQAWLVDIHGQGASSDTVYLGTQNRSTLHDGRVAWKTDGIFGRLQHAGLKILPAADGVAEDRRFNGGYIVQTYGATAGASGLNAVQLEFGSNFRSTPAQRTETARKLWDALRPLVLPPSSRR